MENERSSAGQPTGRIRRIFYSNELKLYISFFLSAWGDRMWAFALSISLGTISMNMRLTAVSGFVNSIVVLLLGASVGRWIDKTVRLKAATITLIVNNVSVVVSASLLFVLLYANDAVVPIWNGGLQILLVSLSIAFCALSLLASMGTKICMTKDWIVVISGGDKDKLAHINAWMLRLNLTSLVIAPIVAGQIMASFHPSAGCFFLAMWNLVSFGVEYVFLRLVYNNYPALAVKSMKPPNVPAADDKQPVKENVEQTQQLTSAESAKDDDQRGQVEPKETDKLDESRSLTIHKSGCCSSLRKHVVSAANGWKLYFQQSTLPASLGLALLFLTVLAFDGVTVVYIYSQGIEENILAACQGVGAVFGIVGSFAYPYLRKRVGLERTGLYALASQITSNTFALLSIWLPGSPFDPVQYFSGFRSQTNENKTTVDQFDNSSFPFDFNETSTNNLTTILPIHQSKCSISAFLVGIMTARFGLWVADLTINQVMQENVAADKRGVVNGVQGSLNMTMNMVKAVLVILLPDPKTFGILIILSYCSVVTAFVSFSYYSRKIRGHLLPCHKRLKSACTTFASDEPIDGNDQPPGQKSETKF